MIVQTIYACLYRDRTLNALDLRWPSWKIWLSGWIRAGNCRSVEKKQQKWNTERKKKREFEEEELQMLL